MPRKPSPGAEKYLVVQLATCMAAYINPIYPSCTNRKLLRAAGSIISLIERRASGLNSGSLQILAFHCALVAAEWAIDNRGNLPRIDATLLQIAAENIKAADTHTGIDWTIRRAA